jgi:hypothetical protein
MASKVSHQWTFVEMLHITVPFVRRYSSGKLSIFILKLIVSKR